MKASDNVFPVLQLSEEAAPTTPAAGQVKIYAKSDGLVYSKDDAGDETPMGGNSPVTINDQTDSYTLVLGDAFALVRLTAATAKSLTVPANSSVAFPVGTVVMVEAPGAGVVTLVEDTGVTINSLDGLLSLAGQYAMVALVKTAADVWTATGALA